MNLTPVLILGVDGQPVTPANSADLAFLAKDATAQTLAKDATAQAILAALQALPQPSTKIHRVTVSLAASLVDQPVSLGTVTDVQAVTVAELTGTVTPTLKFGGAGESAVPLAKGEVRDGLKVGSLYLSTAAGGGAVVLEIHGR